MKRKTLVCLLIGVLFVAVLAVLPVGAATSNNPTDFEFRKDRSATNLITVAQSKNTSSSVYMRCDSCPDYSGGVVPSVGQYTAYVMGSRSEDKDYADCSRGHVYTFREGTTNRMLNWVWENQFEFARVRAECSTGSYPFSAEGEWHADYNW